MSYLGYLMSYLLLEELFEILDELFEVFNETLGYFVIYLGHFVTFGDILFVIKDLAYFIFSLESQMPNLAFFGGGSAPARSIHPPPREVIRGMFGFIPPPVGILFLWGILVLRE